MQDVRQRLRDLTERAAELHRNAPEKTRASVELVGELDRSNAAANLGISSGQLATRIGLTPNVYWKRVQAARVLYFHPRTRVLLDAGETQISHLALLAAHITEANADIILPGIKNKSRREVEGLLSRVTNDGRLLDSEQEVVLRLKLTKSQWQALDRVRGALACSGEGPSLAETMMKALAYFLERHAPLRAERAEAP